MPPEGNPIYFGDYVEAKGAWVPHGQGQMLLNDEVVLEGNFQHGQVVGSNSKYVHSDGSIW